jgi:hypothetical protein
MTGKPEITRWSGSAVTAEVASSSLVLPTILSKRTHGDFSETNEGARRHVSVPFLVSLFPIAMKSDEALDTSELLAAATLFRQNGQGGGDNFRLADNTSRTHVSFAES